MPKFKTLLVLFAIVFFAAFIVLLTLSVKTDDKLNAESKQFVDTVLPKILKNFDVNVFLEYAAPELIKNVPRDKIEKVFQMYRKLGSFEKYLGSKGKAKMSFSPLQWKKWTYARYNCIAKFSNAEAKIKITIIKENNEWYIYHLKINSKIFPKKKKKT